jgi:hypothetical protein
MGKRNTSFDLLGTEGDKSLHLGRRSSDPEFGEGGHHEHSRNYAPLR